MRFHGWLLMPLAWCAGCQSRPAAPVPERAPSRAVLTLEPEARAEESPAEPAEAQPNSIRGTLEPADDPARPSVETPARFRPPDRRPDHDDEQLAAAGIRCFVSKRLRLYTDVDEVHAKDLPPLADQLYDALTAYFGALPPAEDGSEFQMTGYLIHDEALFREQRLMDGLPLLLHGKHQQNRFWVRDQQQTYYRRHLVLHECTHCFMTFVPGTIPPVWYMEGMAELFGTHRLAADGQAEFRILPLAGDDTAGWGRISLIHKDCAEEKSLTVAGVCDQTHDAFFQPQAYAWSWALCKFLDSHPRYGGKFRSLGRHLQDGRFAAEFRKAFGSQVREITTEWTLFHHQLQWGYDTERAAIVFVDALPLDADEERTLTLRADRGWQDAGVRVAAGDVLDLTATGRFTLADVPRPWISEPQGVSIRYVQGQPAGRLLACLDADPLDDTPAVPGTQLLQVVPVGKQARLTPRVPGRLLLRLNDAWDSLADNQGTVTVTIRRAAGTGLPE